jgi:CheY-like chemotaxis protein
MIANKAQTILVVENNPANMELAVDLLEVHGYRALQAVTAEEAICLARAERPCLIVMNIGLAGTDGLEATRLLKMDPQTARIPVVALTAQAADSDKAKTLAAGCIGFITKPIDTRTFARTITLFLSAQRT